MAYREKLLKPISWLIVIIMVVYCILPVYITVTTALKNRIEAFSMPPKWFFEPTIENFVSIFHEHDIMRYLRNSTIVVLGTILIAMPTAVMAAYPLARARSRIIAIMPIILVFAIIVPPIAYVIPLYDLFNRVRLFDTFIGLVLVYVARTCPVAALIMMSTFEGIPKELDEAAFIDGCDRFSTLFRVVLPAASSGFISATLMVALITWNDFMIAFILSGPKTMTLPVSLSMFQTSEGIEWGNIAAAATIAALPMIILCIVLFKYMERGLIVVKG